MFLKKYFCLIIFAWCVAMPHRKIIKQNKNIRLTAVAGTFYPKNRYDLKKQINTFLEDEPIEMSYHDIPMIIVPHAGYNYSGEIAASAYNRIYKKPYKRVILIGPCHNYDFEGISVWRGGSWHTPLGDIPIDYEFIQKIDEYKLFDDNNYKKYHTDEHSLEVQVPFIQTVLSSDVKIVPILIRDFNYAQPLAHVLYDIHKKEKKYHSEYDLNEDTLIVLSTDLSHYYTPQRAQEKDQYAIQDIISSNISSYLDNIKSGTSQLCGDAAVLVGMYYQKIDQECVCKNIKKGNSAKNRYKDTSVVGYASFYYDRIYFNQNDYFPLKEQSILFDLVKRDLYNKVENNNFISNDDLGMYTKKYHFFNKQYPLFVTLKDSLGNLRGCIGTTKIPSNNIIETACTYAFLAATNDERFSPLTADELPYINYEISLLSEMKKIQSIDEIIPGLHGVSIKINNKTGVFLPEVAEEHGWKDAQTILQHLCTDKMGLKKNAYKNKNAEIYIFTTQKLYDAIFNYIF
jgi:AmmeMemoRadiSam system protein B/AmmeMemoRadiSam system protein A